jgi:hypothetical protein
VSARDATRANLNALDMMPTCPVCNDLSAIGSVECGSCGHRLVPGPKRLTHKQKVLQLLSDGKPHNHHELYALRVMGHSRVSDLRADGHNIVQWREGDLYFYRLLLNASPNRTGEAYIPSVSPDAADPASVTAPHGGDALSGTATAFPYQVAVSGARAAQLTLEGSAFRKQAMA